MRRWISLGKLTDLRTKPLQEVRVEGRPVALSFCEGTFGAVDGVCPHAGAALAQGELDKNGHIVCPRHQWTFNCATGEPGAGARGQLARYDLKEEDGELFIDPANVTENKPADRPLHALTRKIKRAPGPLRVVGISTTVVNKEFPRSSTSTLLLEEALAEARRAGAESRLIKLNDLNFRACEGYYSRSAEACTWPCTITQMDATDELEQVYEALVFWADVVLIATPIRWGAASSLYFKMAERMNCIQNQKTIADRTLIKKKVAGFIITGGQDNIQAVAGQMMVFFSELGFMFPPNSFAAHSRGWIAEDMENNVDYVHRSDELRRDVQGLVRRCMDTARSLIPEVQQSTPAPVGPFTARTVKLVQESWAKVGPIAPQAAAIFYNTLFTMDPQVKALFRGDITVQGARLMDMIGAAVEQLEDLDTLIPVLQDLGKRHVAYGVQDHHYATVGAALLATLEMGLGAAFTAAVKAAWTHVFGVIAGVMKQGAERKDDSVKLVQDSWAKVAPIAPQAAAIFYNTLFTLDPEVKKLFRGDITIQGARLMEMIGAAVEKLDDLETLVPILQDLGKRHVAYGVKDGDFATVGAALLATLEMGLGAEFTPEVRAAWTGAYGLIAKVMREAAATPA